MALAEECLILAWGNWAVSMTRVSQSMMKVGKNVRILVIKACLLPIKHTYFLIKNSFSSLSPTYFCSITGKNQSILDLKPSIMVVFMA